MNLGTLEELVLLAVCGLQNEAYGVTVLEEVNRQTGRTLTLGAIHTTLYRLQDKGMVTSAMGGATEERGGRRKRLYRVTGVGLDALREMRDVRERMWKLLPT